MAARRSRRYFVAPAMLLLTLGFTGGALFLTLHTWAGLIRSMNNYGGLASWVQAVMSVAAIVAGFCVLLLQNYLEHRAVRRDCKDEVCLMAAIAESCHEQFAEWIDRIVGADGPLGRPKSQPHLLIAVEGMMFRDVAQVRANRLMIELRRIVQDVWWEVETADECLRGEHPPELLAASVAELRRLHARTKAISEELQSLGA